MANWIVGLAIFVFAAFLLSRFLGRTLLGTAVGANPVGQPDNTPKGGETNGPLQTYFDKIVELDGGGYDGFFATVKDPTSSKFVQVSVGAPPGKAWAYQFDLPLNDWAKEHQKRIEFEARSRGLQPKTTASGGFEFLDIDFTDRDQHEKFARWVMTEVFELSENLDFEITWG